MKIFVENLKIFSKVNENFYLQKSKRTEKVLNQISIVVVTKRVIRRDGVVERIFKLLKIFPRISNIH